MIFVKIRLWWKRLKCGHKWELKRVFNPYREWFECIYCGKQEETK